MGLIRNDELEKYEEASNSSRKEFFSLNDDGDKAYVRFMHEGMEDISRVVCHTIEVEPKKFRKISCLRHYDEPLTKCPLCNNKQSASVRIFLELRVYETVNGKFTGNYTTQIWERGKDFNKKLQSLCNRLGDKALCDTVFEIERIGKKGDQRTTYEIYECNNITTEEAPFDGQLEEQYNPIGTVVLDKKFEEVQTFINTGKFPEEQLERREAPQQETYSEPQRPQPSYQPQPEPEQRPQRRRI